MRRVTTPQAEQANGLQTSALSRVRAIDADPDLSEDGKRRQIETVNAELRQRLETLRADEKTALAARRSDLEARLFGRVDPHDSASVIAHRDAADRAAKITSEDVATATILRALNNGDHALATATARHAADHDWAEAFSAWSSVQPSHAHDIVDELADIDAYASIGQRMASDVTSFTAPALGNTAAGFTAPAMSA